MAGYGRILDWVRVHVFRKELKPSNDSVLPTFRWAAAVQFPKQLNLRLCFSAPARPRTARVDLDDLDIDMVSLEDKWDKGDSSSRRSSTIPPSADGDKSFVTHSPPDHRPALPSVELSSVPPVEDKA